MNPRLTIKFDDKFSRMLGHVYGDGSCWRNMIVSFTNKDRTLVREFKRLVKDIFGDVSIYVARDTRNDTINVRLPKITGLMIERVVSGLKRKEIPLEYFIENKILIPSFIASFFDDEGSVQSRELDIYQKDTKILSCLKRMFFEIGITTSDIKTRSVRGNSISLIRISSRGEIQKFRNIVKISHPRKKILLARLLESYKLRFAKHELEAEVLTYLKCKKSTTSQIAADLDVGFTSVWKALKRLKSKGMIRCEKRMLSDKIGRKYAAASWCYVNGDNNDLRDSGNWKELGIRTPSQYPERWHQEDFGKV
jgi:predicted transcriptional regulator